jgi:hypothetical protein
MPRIKFKDLKPGDQFRSARQGVVTVIKLIRIHKTSAGDMYRFETDAPSGYICAAADMPIMKVN